MYALRNRYRNGKRRNKGDYNYNSHKFLLAWSSNVAHYSPARAMPRHTRCNFNNFRAHAPVGPLLFVTENVVPCQTGRGPTRAGAHRLGTSPQSRHVCADRSNERDVYVHLRCDQGRSRLLYTREFLSMFPTSLWLDLSGALFLLSATVPPFPLRSDPTQRTPSLKSRGRQPQNRARRRQWWRPTRASPASVLAAW